MPPPLKPQISTQQEELLWERRILSLQCSSGLIQAVIFYLIKTCGVYQGKDLRQLKTEHVNFGEDSVGNYVTIDFSSVVISGKVVRHYEDPNNPRSLYKLLKTYIRYLANEGAFLVRPISSIKDYICYSPWPLGVSIIEHMVQTLMEEAGQGSRYGNISASLLALDVLKSYGTGRHCLSTWVDCLGGASLCYKAKVLSGKIPDCTSINCRDLNAEAGLIMSHLLDPPYPSHGHNSQSDVKVSVDENEVRNPERNTSNMTLDTPQSGLLRGSNVNSKSVPNRDRLKVVNSGDTGLTLGKRIAGGASLNLHKKQAKLMRFKSRCSQKLHPRPEKVVALSAVDLTSELNSTPQTSDIKSELQIDEDIPDVEIDVAGNLQLGSENNDEEGFISNGDIDELSENSMSCEQQNLESSEAGKIPKIEQHFQELESSLCRNPGDFEDAADQREDITLDKAGETTEDVGNSGARANPHSSYGTSSNCKDGPNSSDFASSLTSGQEASQSPKKQEHLSLVAGLENWLGRLKQRVNNGSDSDMNGLLLQATSQLKFIADKVIASRDETQIDSPNDGIGKKALGNSKMNCHGQHMEHQHQNSSQSKQGELLAQAAEGEDMRASPGHGTVTVRNDLVKSCDSSQGEPRKENEPEDVHYPGSSPGHGDPDSVDLSPPVLSPQPPIETDSCRDSFLFFNLTHKRRKESQCSSSENENKDIQVETPQSKPSKPSPVPDLVRFLDSANLQVQSLLSTPSSRVRSPMLHKNSESDHLSTVATSSSSQSDKKINGLNKSRSDSEASTALGLPVSAASCAKSNTNTNSTTQPQSASKILQNKSCSSWPVLRSVLEEALPPRTFVATEKNHHAISSRLDHGGSNTNSTTDTAAVSRSGIPSILPHMPVGQSPTPHMDAHTGMYTFHSDHQARAAFQSLTVVSGDKRSHVFTFPDLPLDHSDARLPRNMKHQTAGGQSLRNTRSELCLGDYLPYGACVPASSIKVATQQGSNGLEVVLRFDFSKKGRNANV